VSAETLTSAPEASSPEVSVTLLYLVKQVELAIRSRLDDVVAEHGITTIQYTAMTVLERHPGMISAQLARNSFVRAQSMAQLVDALEARGLVERTRDPSSRRQMLISLTAHGRDLLDRMRAPVDRIEAEMTAALTGPQRDMFADALRAARVALAGDHVH